MRSPAAITAATRTHCYLEHLASVGASWSTRGCNLADRPWPDDIAEPGAWRR